MNPKLTRRWIWLTLLMLLCAACNPAAAPTTTTAPTEIPAATQAAVQTITDDLNRQVTVTLPAQHIVTLGPSIVEGLFAIGAGDQIAGREEFSIYPPAALEIPSIGSLYGSLPSETILALEPDLVIAPEIISPEQLAALEALGLTIYYQNNPTSFPELYQNLRELGVLSGHENEAEDLITSLEARVQAVEQAVAGLEARPRVFYELDATDPENPYTTGAGTFIDTLIVMAGGENIGAALDSAYAQISSEQILLADPEIILLGDAEYGITAADVAARPGWADLQAVQSEAIYPFDPNLGSIPSPRLVDGLETMASIFHPEAFDQ